MKSISINNIKERILKNVIGFCSGNNHSDDKKSIIEDAVNIFKDLEEFDSATLFLFNQESSRYYLEYSTKSAVKFELETRFIQLSENENLPGAFVESIENYAKTIDDKQLMVFPLTDQFGKVGLFIVYISNSEFDFQESSEILRMFSNYFALRLGNMIRKEELARIKAASIETVATYSEELARSTRDLRNLLNSVHTGIILFDKNTGDIADVNVYVAKLIGLPKESLIGTPRNDLFLFSEYKPGEGNLSKTGEKFLKKGDGSIVHVISSMSEIVLNKEEFIAENIVDISDQKKMENELIKAHDELEFRVSERTKELSKTNIALQEQINEKIKAQEETLKLFQAVHQSPALIMITDLAGAIEYVNPIFTKVTGYSLEEIKGMNPRMLKSGDINKEGYLNLWQTIINGEVWVGEFRNKKKNGELFWVSSIVTPIRNSQGRIINYLAVQQDISEKKIAEQKLIEAKERAEQSDKLKTNLLANMSHEFRTPMIGIIGFTQILEDEITNPEQKEILEQINQCSDRLMTTLNNVLSLSQLQSVELDLTLEEAGLDDLLERVVEKYEPLATQKCLKFVYNKEETAYKCKVEPQLCSQLFANIIDNAVKFTKTGLVQISLAKYSEDDMPAALVIVKDTGVGIAEKNRERLFEPFRQESEGYSRSFEGLGLGLALSKRIVDLHKGRIFYEPNTPSGAVFKLIIPLEN